MKVINLKYASGHQEDIRQQYSKQDTCRPREAVWPMKHPPGVELQQLASRLKNSDVRDMKTTEKRRQNTTRNITRVQNVQNSRLVGRLMTQYGAIIQTYRNAQWIRNWGKKISQIFPVFLTSQMFQRLSHILF